MNSNIENLIFAFVGTYIIEISELRCYENYSDLLIYDSDKVLSRVFKKHMSRQKHIFLPKLYKTGMYKLLYNGKLIFKDKTIYRFGNGLRYYIIDGGNIYYLEENYIYVVKNRKPEIYSRIPTDDLQFLYSLNNYFVLHCYGKDVYYDLIIDKNSKIIFRSQNNRIYCSEGNCFKCENKYYKICSHSK